LRNGTSNGTASTCYCLRCRYCHCDKCFNAHVGSYPKLEYPAFRRAGARFELAPCPLFSARVDDLAIAVSVGPEGISIFGVLGLDFAEASAVATGTAFIA